MSTLLNITREIMRNLKDNQQDEDFIQAEKKSVKAKKQTK